MVKQINLATMPKAEAIKLAITLLKLPKDYAPFFISVLRGETKGDIESKGNEVKEK